jgi:hypothetical protein
VVERCRLAVRTAGFVICRGKLEHREGNTNVVVSQIERLSRNEPPKKPAKEVAPPVERETGRPARGGGLSKRHFDGVREAAMSELAAALPAPHSFGRRGR